MSDIPIPQKGSPITLEWGKAVTESCNAVRAIGTGGLVRSGPFGLGEAPLPANRRDRRLQQKLTPFAIRLKPKTDDAEAQWIIYLPSEEILSYNNNAVIPFGDLTPIDGQDNWYALNIPLTGGIVYLNLSTGDESESGSESEESVPPTVEYSLESSEKTSIALARVAYDEQSKSASVYQYVTSALHLGNGGDGVSIESITSDADEYADDVTVTNVTVKTTDGKEHEFKVVAKNGSEGGGESGGGEGSGSISFVGDMRYDSYTHQIQKRVDTYDFATGQLTQGDWVMIDGGQAVPHSSTIEVS